MKTTSWKMILVLGFAALGFVLTVLWPGARPGPVPAAVVSRPDRTPAATAGAGIDIPTRTRQLIAYSHASLTPSQQEVKRVALTALPAPCCDDYSADTCCCPCNLAKSIWGLANHLIADQGLGADQVREEVQSWITIINPAGFSGDACYTGGCGHAFADNGCGGMTEAELVLD